jgi:hypothetical protein
MLPRLGAALLSLGMLACTEPSVGEPPFAIPAQTPSSAESVQNPGKLIHVIVALCDNRFKESFPSRTGSAMATIQRTISTGAPPMV